MAAPTPRKTGGGGGLSLYANLLDKSGQAGGATISSAPVKYEALSAAEEEALAKKKDGTVAYHRERDQ